MAFVMSLSVKCALQFLTQVLNELVSWRKTPSLKVKIEDQHEFPSLPRNVPSPLGHVLHLTHQIFRGSAVARPALTRFFEFRFIWWRLTEPVEVKHPRLRGRHICGGNESFTRCPSFIAHDQ